MISKKEVEHTANLARLELSNEEKEKFTSQLGAILNYFDELKKIDTSGIEPTSHAIPMKAVLREDEVKPWTNSEAILKNAPSSQNNFFSVPRILTE